MRILLIGFVAFCSWTLVSTYIYVCKIRGFCYESTTVQSGSDISNRNIVDDTLKTLLIPTQTEDFKDFVIYFEFDKSEFIANAESNKFFDESNAYLNQNAQAIINITGYTDAIGTNQYNMALGYRRAERIQHYFESKGMYTNKILIATKGETDPASDNTTSIGRSYNRRTVITVKK